MIASFLLLFLTLGCESPVNSGGGAGAPATGGAIESEYAASENAGDPEAGLPAAESGGESRSSRDGTAGEPVGSGSEPAAEDESSASPDPSANAGTADSAVQAFEGAQDLDDPFAVIGPAFSGLGIQSYSSGCDPFEDKYGTCL